MIKNRIYIHFFRFFNGAENKFIIFFVFVLLNENVDQPNYLLLGQTMKLIRLEVCISFIIRLSSVHRDSWYCFIIRLSYVHRDSWSSLIQLPKFRVRCIWSFLFFKSHVFTLVILFKIKINFCCCCCLRLDITLDMHGCVCWALGEGGDWYMWSGCRLWHHPRVGRCRLIATTPLTTRRLQTCCFCNTHKQKHIKQLFYICIYLHKSQIIFIIFILL